MPDFSPLPLGSRIPGSPHAVSCSLPTMRDVIGYEEKDAVICSQIDSGYPRFVVHPFVRRLAATIAREENIAGRAVWLTSSGRMAEALAIHLGRPDAQVFARGDIHGLSHQSDRDVERRARVFLQNVGGIFSSRHAEDALVARGVLASPAAEQLFDGDAAAEVRRELRRAYAPARAEARYAPGDRDLFFAPTGMNAVYAAFRAVSELQAARGRTMWVQLGWLYLDTIAILKTLTPDRARDYVCVHDVTDLAALERVLAQHGPRVAGIVTEVPTNPLIQTADVAAITSLARAHGARVVLDPTIASPFNLDVLLHADVVVNSLTKYAANQGDLMAGAVVINPDAADAEALRAAVARHVEPIYARDLARLAAEIGEYASVIARVNATTPRVVAFLEAHPAVRDVFWSLRAGTRAGYLALARTPESVGGVISFTLHVPLERFYDRVRIPKGPSFGMSNSLLCPYLYLAHYDLLSTAAGRAELAAHGLDPELVRLSIGLEPPEAIIAALDEALR